MLGVLSRCQRLALPRVLASSTQKIVSCRQTPAQSSLCPSCLRSESRRFASTKEDGKKKKGPITWKSLGITFGIGGALLGWMFYIKKEKQRAVLLERSGGTIQGSWGDGYESARHSDGIARFPGHSQQRAFPRRMARERRRILSDGRRDRFCRRCAGCARTRTGAPSTPARKECKSRARFGGGTLESEKSGGVPYASMRRCSHARQV
ncbi:protein SCO1 homolog, mitochondrial [Ixodes scapularis]